MKRFIKILALISVLIFSSTCGVIINNDKFNSEKWKNGDSRTRGKMVYDLQNSRILIGKTEAEVVELLGKDDYPSEHRKTYEIDTNVITDIYFTVHFDRSARKVSSTDIGD